MHARECYERSRALLKRNDHTGALAAVRQALALEPTMSEAHNFAGWILLQLPSRTASDLDAAIASFREARRLAPSDPVSFANLCDALVAANRGREAVELAEAALGEHSFDAAAHNWLGWFFLELGGDLARAATHLNEATRLRPAWGVAWLNLATALDRSGRPSLEVWRAYDEADRCRDAHDPKRARRRRLELEKEMRARGEEPPKQPRLGMNGEPLGPEYDEIERACDERRFDDAIAAIEKLAKVDPMGLIYSMGIAEHGAESAHANGMLAQAGRLADLAERGGVDYAAGSSSGAEGMARTYDLEQLRKRLRRWR